MNEKMANMQKWLGVLDFALFINKEGDLDFNEFCKFTKLLNEYKRNNKNLFL